MEIDEKNLNRVIVVGDRVLVKPKNPQERTKTGLFLPAGIQEKEKIHSGYIVKTGPGYPLPAIPEDNEPWKNNNEEVKYVPLQVKVGDLAVFLQNSGYEIEFHKEKYLIIPQSAILLLIRDEGLFD